MPPKAEPAMPRAAAHRSSAATRSRKRRTPPGASPGTLTPDPTALRPAIRVIAYDGEHIEEREIADVEELESLVHARPVTWVNVDGLGDLDLIRRLGELFSVHRLALEDVVNLHQRAKVEEYEDHIFIATRTIAARVVDGAPSLDTEQVTMFLGGDYLLTFHERPSDTFDPVRARLRQHLGRIREAGPDYLAYALLDAVIDGYFPVLERYGELVEELEDAAVSQPGAELVTQVHRAKRDLLTLRRAIWPQREMINTLIRDPSSLLSDHTRVYLRDCYDHTIQLMDMVETYREIGSGLIEIYLSSVSTRMNEVMKVLTIIATIFIPLGFIAGLYGMNFNPQASPWNMPELGWYWGYPSALGLMAAVALGLIVYFRLRGWLGGRRPAGKR